MEANEKDVSVTSLKRPHIVVTWKESVRKSLGDIKVEVDNPARKKLKETEEKPAGGGGGSHTHKDNENGAQRAPHFLVVFFIACIFRALSHSLYILVFLNPN